MCAKARQFEFTPDNPTGECRCRSPIHRAINREYLPDESGARPYVFRTMNERPDGLSGSGSCPPFSEAGGLEMGEAHSVQPLIGLDRPFVRY